MDERRTDTREQIRVVALEMFAERGYAGTSLREIAERLGVTKAAVYYHFPTKEDILASLLKDFLAQLDELIAWTERQPRGTDTRRAALDRYAQMLGGPKTDLARFMQEGQSAIRELAAGLQVRKHFAQFQALLAAPDESAEGKLRAQVALVALHLAAFGPLSPAAGLRRRGGRRGPHRAARRGHAGRQRRSRGGRAVSGPRRRRSAQPWVSVVVPARNEARNLEVVLPALAAVRPAVHEIIVVDGNSVDDTAETAHRVLPDAKVDQPDPHRQGQRAGLRVRRRHRRHHRHVRRRRLRRSGRDPGLRRGARRGRRLRQGQPVHRRAAAATTSRRCATRATPGSTSSPTRSSAPATPTSATATTPSGPTSSRCSTSRRSTRPPPAMLWGDGFEIETLLNCRVAVAGLPVTEVPSVERPRIFGRDQPAHLRRRQPGAAHAARRAVRRQATRQPSVLAPVAEL